ncbi:MAG: ShlB/FhaC/HecB family hemolysin secretion/activation protein [Symploca sp. SIO1B1]|nr:ShlB/FhaC/HecB family hemolysin secretion/activation protein [Symploca sp. SIO1B1]
MPLRYSHTKSGLHKAIPNPVEKQSILLPPESQGFSPPAPSASPASPAFAKQGFLSRIWYHYSWSLVVLLNSIIPTPVTAQILNIAQVTNSPTVPLPPSPSLTPLPTPNLPPLPSEKLLETPSLPEGLPQVGITDTIIVEKFEFTGNTVFSTEELAEAIKLCLSEATRQEDLSSSNNCQQPSQQVPLASIANQPLSLAQLNQITYEIAKLYAQQGYSTSGARIARPQKLQPEVPIVVTIKVIEGKLQQGGIEVNSVGSGRLHSDYVQSRLGVRESEPLNVAHLKEALLELSLDPLIENISATLAAGSNLGENLLQVEYEEANSFNAQFTINNGRSPSVGTIQGKAVLTEANLLGNGDSLSIGYSKSEGSSTWNASYNFPLNANYGTLGFNYGKTESGIIESPFEDIDKDGSSPDITSASNYYELTLRQPIIRKIRGLEAQEPENIITFEEFALGLTASWRESQSFLLDIPFPLAPGADEDGRTRIFALRLFQDWKQENSREVIAFRSQLNFGLNAFNSTFNQPIPGVEFVPDSRFLSWQWQGQWVRFLAEDTLFLVRSYVQLTSRGLVPTEQFSMGGFDTVRGYRQDSLVSDNGIFASAEFKLPILRAFEGQGVLQLVPFVDFATGWNTGKRPPNTNTLAAVGMGLQLRLGNDFSARFDWGLPLISVDSTSENETWQENGLYFTVQYNPF